MIDMNKPRSLIAFVGMRDPYPESDEEPGPLLSLLLAAEKAGQGYDEAWLLCTGGTFLERARDLEREARDEGLAVRFYPVDFPVQDVIDYAEIWVHLGRGLETIKGKAGSLPREWIFLLDSGTPQMKTSLFLAARSGLFPATLVQGIPARFAGGTYKYREVRLDGIPEVHLATRELFDPGDLPAVGSRRTVLMNASTSLADARTAYAEPDDKEPVVVSSAFAEVIRKAFSAARYDDPVLMLGETGTGKTMTARRIHEAGSRAAGPFVEVNCSAIPESMAESELFGHVRGAFTGAASTRAGKFRAAQGGTMFLDEVGDLSLDVQAKLLKAIEDKLVTPVGSDEPLEADARLIAATNHDLPALIKEGRFRRDLYERLKVVVIRLPPLRERREDIRPLALRFMAGWNEQYDEHRYLTKDAMILLESYPWPGNVRELKNALRSAACSSASEALGPESLPEELLRSPEAGSRGLSAEGPVGTTGGSLDGSSNVSSNGILPVIIPPEGVNLKARLLQVEWEYVSAALRKAEGKREVAARLLGMTGHAFRKALKERLSAFADEGWEEGL
jgi:DNA-binding NtrC family response regulator